VFARRRLFRGLNRSIETMKVVIIGGSAHSTPNLFAHAPLRAAADDLEIVLVGRSGDRLAAVARAIESLSDSVRWHVACEDIGSGSGIRALRGADIVLCQARYGGYEARSSDETFPLRYGMCGDEGLGVGGLAAAWRAWPPLRAALESVRRECPATRVVLMTSPVGILTRCALAAEPDLWIAGICELPWTTLREACDAAGTDAHDATFEYAGVNHIGWLCDVSSSGVDVTARYGAARAQADGFPDGALIDRLHAIPLKYLAMHYDAESVLRDQRNAVRPRGQILAELRDHAFDVYKDGDAQAIAAAMTSRPTPWYEHAVSPLIAGFAGLPSTIPYFLTVRNASHATEFRADDVLEIPHRFAAHGPEPIARRSTIPQHIRAELDPFVGYERAASEAVRSRSVTGVESAVRSHPWVREPSVAAKVAAEICR
jgi:6-phospho-beta-glucosidase